VNALLFLGEVVAPVAGRVSVNNTPRNSAGSVASRRPFTIITIPLSVGELPTDQTSRMLALVRDVGAARLLRQPWSAKGQARELDGNHGASTSLQESRTRKRKTRPNHVAAIMRIGPWATPLPAKGICRHNERNAA
jgi:hypothetical protein